MEDELLKSILLGTDQYLPSDSEKYFPWAEKLKTEDKPEARVLKLAAAYFTYQEAGQKLERKEIPLTLPQAEGKAAISNQVAVHFKTALKDQDNLLLDFLIYQVNQARQVLRPDLVPDLLDRVRQQKKQRKPYLEACGEVGKWLCALREEWKHLLNETFVEGDWETGSWEQRYFFIQNLRNENPLEAREKIKAVIHSEKADKRVLLLEVLKENLSSADETFLLAFLNDKSKKVKETARDLLRRIPDSELAQLFLNYLKQVLQLPKRSLAKMLANRELELAAQPEPEKALFDLGLEKVSSVKGVDDHLCWIAHSLTFTHPQGLASHLNISLDELLKLLLKIKPKKFLIPYLEEASLVFQIPEWAHYLVANHYPVSPKLLELLPKDEQMRLLLKWADKDLARLLPAIFNDDYETISQELGERILKALAKSPYQVNQYDYRALALYLPPASRKFLDTLMEKDVARYSDNYFKNRITEMQNILEIKSNLNLSP